VSSSGEPFSKFWSAYYTFFVGAQQLSKFNIRLVDSLLCSFRCFLPFFRFLPYKVRPFLFSDWF
jgi:hypothetical protein